MSHFSSKQRRALVDLAQRYAPALHAVVTRRGPAPSDADCVDVAELAEAFANEVVGIVCRPSPECAAVGVSDGAVQLATSS